MADTLESIERWAGRPLPDEYRRFLAAHAEDRAEGDLVLLYGRSSFLERNETCETKRYCPEYATIGDDSGGRQILLSLANGEILLLGAGALSTLEMAERLGGSFEEWLHAGCPLPDEE